MRRILLIDRPVDLAAMGEASQLGAVEIVFCPNGTPPTALQGLPMGYCEVSEAGD